jgi:hypothetical protein
MRDENAIENWLLLPPADRLKIAAALCWGQSAPTVKESLTVRERQIAEATERGWPIQETK